VTDVYAASRLHALGATDLDVGQGNVPWTCQAAAPAIAALVGETAADALATTRRMYEITLAEHPLFRVPALEFLYYAGVVTPGTYR
jgi:hypothetical protein